MILRRLPVLVLVLLTTGCGYNRIQELDERVAEDRANIDAELMRRADLIPNLVSTVDEAAAFEQETFTEVARARAGLSQSREQLAEAVQQGADPETLSETNAAVADNLRLFLNVAVEAYPQLTANQSFIRLQDELTETENRIGVARRDYNQTVREFNTYVRRFPQTLTARAIGADPKEPFQAPEGSTEVPQVEFGS